MSEFLTVYLSSSFQDLQQHREAVVRALNQTHGVMVIAMEKDLARDDRPLDVCLKRVAECDIYVGLIAWRYGFVPSGAGNPEGLSITELEMKAASAAGKLLLIFMLREDAPWVPTMMDSVTGDNERGKRIEAWRRRLLETAVVKEFSDAAELALAVRNSVSRIAAERSIRRPSATRRAATLLPDIDWVEIPTGAFRYQGGQSIELPRFFIARYPVTNIQYQCFIDAGGYDDARWWQALKKMPGPAESSWPQPNRPRTDVSWYEATAFCRWLSAQLGDDEIRLSSEQDWERAAAGPDGREFPWGSRYQPGMANVNEKLDKLGPWYLEQTTAVGVYPQGGSAEGVLDLAGNVWEWCLNESDEPPRTAPGGDAFRVLRGGSWDFRPQGCRAADRSGLPPVYRDNIIGFRVCRGSPIVSPAAAPLGAGPRKR